MAMDLSHRVADDKGFKGILKIIYEIKYPLSLVIPILLCILAITSYRALFGLEWDIGAFSTSFLPFGASYGATIAGGDVDFFLSSLVVGGTLLYAVSAYFFVVFLTKRHLPAVITALLLLVPPDLFSQNPPERIVVALTGGDGAHALALSILPLIFIFFTMYVRNGKKINVLLLGISLVFVSLISFFTQFMLILFFLVLAVSEALIGQSRAKLSRTAIVLLLYLLLIVLIYNFSLWQILISEDGLGVFTTIGNVIPLSFFLIPVLGTIAFLIFDRRPQLQPLFISLVVSIVFFVFKSVGNSFGGMVHVGGERYEGELAFGVAFFAGIILMWIFDGIRAGSLLKRIPALLRYRETVAVGVVSILIIVITISLVAFPKSIG